MPPTHFEGGNVNMFQPYVVGQSGTDSPESVLVTRLPARTRSTVQPATNLAKRWSMRTYLAGRAGGLYLPAPPALPALPALICGRRGCLEREVGFFGFLG